MSTPTPPKCELVGPAPTATADHARAPRQVGSRLFNPRITVCRLASTHYALGDRRSAVDMMIHGGLRAHTNADPIPDLSGYEGVLAWALACRNGWNERARGQVIEWLSAEKHTDIVVANESPPRVQTGGRYEVMGCR